MFPFPMKLLPASLSDQQTFFALHVELFRHHIEEIWGWDDDWQLTNFKTEWNEVLTETIDLAGETAGYIQTRREPDHLYLLNLALYPRFQSQGTGTTAMELLQQRAARENLAIKLSVFRTNPRVIRFYQRLGFRTEAETHAGLQMQWAPGHAPNKE